MEICIIVIIVCISQMILFQTNDSTQDHSFFEHPIQPYLFSQQNMKLLPTFSHILNLKLFQNLELKIFHFFYFLSTLDNVGNYNHVDNDYYLKQFAPSFNFLFFIYNQLFKKPLIYIFINFQYKQYNQKDFYMGGRSSQNDPQIVKQLKKNTEQIMKLQKKIQKLRADYQEALKQAKRLQNPVLYREIKEKGFQNFLESISKFKFTEKVTRKDTERLYVLIGNISSGKTSLINKVCNLKLPIGLGECTDQTNCVAQNKEKKIKIFDSPGVNEDFSFYNHETLEFFYSMDRVFILYPQSIKNCRQVVSVMCKIKPNDVYMVRTKCDTWTPQHSKTIAQEIQTDKKYLLNMGLDIPVLATSSNRDNSFLDNEKFEQLLIA